MIERETIQPHEFHIPGLELSDSANNLELMYVYPRTERIGSHQRHSAAGWLLTKVAGRWVKLRKATERDLQVINAAVVTGHHKQS